MPQKSVKAAPKERTIEFRIRFWTDGLADGPGRITPKNAWDYGVVHAVANKSHGITASNPVNFNSLAELSVAVEKLLIKTQVKLHKGRKSDKYFR